MLNKTLLSQLLELAQSPATFSAGVLGSSSNPSKKKIKNTKFAGKIAYENEEVSKVDRARAMLKTMLADEDFDRQQVLEQLMKHLGITEETATSYFQRIAKEMGLTGRGDDDEKGMSSGPAPEDENAMSSGNQALEQPTQSPDPAEPDATAEQPLTPPEGTFTSDDPDRQGAIRVIKNAHLVYKRQNEEGTFTELWVYNIQSNVADELEIRRDILAGTDIPPRRQQSEDGSQEYRLTTLGNAQMLEISGLPQ